MKQFTQKLQQLPTLVANKNLPEITQLFKLLKSEQAPHGHYSYSNDDYIKRAFRDALIIQEYDIAKLLIAEANIYINGYVSPDESVSYVHRYIYYAVKTGKLPFVELLVENGANIKPHNSYYETGDDTGIRTAVEEGHSHIVEYLLSKGAKSSGTIGGMRRATYIAHAAAKNDLATVEVLAKYGALKQLEASFSLANEKYGEMIRNCEYHITSKYSDDTRASLVEKVDSAKDYMKSYYLRDLSELDEKKPQIMAKYEQLKEEYERIIRVLMDYAVGCDLSNETYHKLSFLENMTICGINFVGVSVGGYPVTREMLQQEKLVGYENAIVNVPDIELIEDAARRKKITERLIAQMNIKGGLINNNIVNLIPLWRAAEIGDVSALNVRLAAGGDPNETHYEFSLFDKARDPSAIVFAARNGHEAILDILVAHPKFDNKTLPDAILAAGRAGHDSLKLKLVGMQDVDQLDADGNTLLHHAVTRGDVNEVKALLARKANVNLKGSSGYPLHIAASKSCCKQYTGEPSKNHIEIIRILLEQGANPDLLTDYSNRNALMCASSAGSSEAVEMLLSVSKKNPVVITEDCSYGSAPKQKTVPWFLNMMFDSYGSKEWLSILSLLKKHGANLGLLSSDERNSLLHKVMRDFPSLDSVYSNMREIRYSVAGCEDRVSSSMLSKTQRDLIQKSQRRVMQQMQLMDFLLENDVNVSLTTRDGDTALHDFMKKIDLDHVVNGYARIIDKFVKQPGFNIDARDADGKTILHLAASRGIHLAVKCLISRGADPDVQDKWGNTPLHYALGDGDFIIHASLVTVQTLLQVGASTDISNVQGLTASERSQTILNELMQTETFKAWSFEVKTELQSELENARAILSLPAKRHKKNDFNDTPMQNYINKCRENSANCYTPDLSAEDQLLVNMYKDGVSDQIMQVPVVFNERVYDLDNLLALHYAGKPDPFTQKPIDLSDIQSAETIADEIVLLIQYIKKSYPLMLTENLHLSDELTEPAAVDKKPVVISNAILAPGVNGVFGKSKREDNADKLDNGCICS